MSDTASTDDLWAKIERGRERALAAHDAHIQECIEIAKTDPVRALIHGTMCAPCYADLIFSEFDVEPDSELEEEIRRLEEEGTFYVDTTLPEAGS